MTHKNSKLILKDPTKLKLILQALGSSMEEVNVRLDELGMNLRGAGNSNVTLTDVLIPKESFEEFPVIDAGNDGIKFRINVSNILKILGRSKPGDMVTLEQTSRTLNITIEGQYKKTFEMSMTEFDSNADKLPKVSFDNELTVGPGILHDIIGDLKLISDQVQIEVKDNKVQLNGKGRDLNSGATLDFYGEDAKILKVVRNEKDANAWYAFAMFESVVSALKGLDTTVIMEFDSSFPMRLRYDIKEFGSLHHFIAPFVKE